MMRDASNVALYIVFVGTVATQSVPSQHVGVLVESGGDGLQIVAFEMAFAAVAAADDAVNDVARHAPETNLEVHLLDLHVDEDGRERADGDAYMLVVLFGQTDEAFEDLLFSLEHTVNLLHGEGARIVVALIDIGVNHVGGAEEMENVSMRLRSVAQHIEGILKECARDLLIPRLPCCHVLFGILSGGEFLALQFLLMLFSVLNVERRIGYHALNAVKVPFEVFVVEKADEHEHTALYDATFHGTHRKAHHEGPGRDDARAARVEANDVAVLLEVLIEEIDDGKGLAASVEALGKFTSLALAEGIHDPFLAVGIGCQHTHAAVFRRVNTRDELQFGAMHFKETEQDVTCKEIVDVAGTVGIEGGVVVTLKHVDYLLEVVFVVGVDGFDAAMAHHHFELVVAHEQIVPFVAQLHNLQVGVVDIVADALVVVLDAVLIGVAADGYFACALMLVVGEADGFENLIRHEASFQFLHHGFAVSVSAEPLFVVVDVVVHIQ